MLIDPLEVIAEVFLRPDIAGTGMTLELFSASSSSTQTTEFATGLGRSHFLVCGCAKELANP